jgi:hypothetical protein
MLSQCAFPGKCTVLRRGNPSVIHQTPKYCLWVPGALRCALVHAAMNPGPKASQVPVSLFQAALQMQGIIKDDGECEWEKATDLCGSDAGSPLPNRRRLQ